MIDERDAFLVASCHVAAEPDAPEPREAPQPAPALVEVRTPERPSWHPAPGAEPCALSEAFHHVGRLLRAVEAGYGRWTGIRIRCTPGPVWFAWSR